MTSPALDRGPTDVAVIGAGPAGLAAAVTTAEAGLTVAVIDANTQPGGQFWRHRDESAEARTIGQHSVKTYESLRRRFDAARATGRLRYLPNTQVWFVESPTDGSQLYLLRLTGFGDVGPQPPVTTVEATTMIMCPGGYDRQLPIPGWDLPGVMAAGGVQAMIKGYGVVAGTRAVVAGTGPFLLPVATGLARAGATVVGICDTAAVTGWLPHLGGAAQVPTKGLEAVELAGLLARHRIPYWTRSAITSINGTDEVRSATVAKVDADGRVRPGTGRELAVDLVALGWGFTPALELITAVGADTRVDVDGSLVAQVDTHQRTTVVRTYAAGEVTGVGGAALAALEGELAGLAAAADLGRDQDPRRTRRLQRGIGRARAFAAAMHRAHPVPARWSEWLTDSTIVCRCEEVTYGDVTQARDDLGAEDARTMKLLSRTGMGWCQGRVCGFTTAQLAAGSAAVTADQLRPIAQRPLCAPIALAELAQLAASDRTASPSQEGQR